MVKSCLHRLLASAAPVACIGCIGCSISVGEFGPTEIGNRCKQPMQATDATLGGPFQSISKVNGQENRCTGCLHWLLLERIRFVLIRLGSFLGITNATDASNRCNRCKQPVQATLDHFPLKCFENMPPAVASVARIGCIGCLHRLHWLLASVALVTPTDATDAGNRCNRCKQPMQSYSYLFFIKKR